MKIKLSVAFFGFLLMSTGLSPQNSHDVTLNTSGSWKYQTGNDLLTWCKGTFLSIGGVYCTEYIWGVEQMIELLQDAPGIDDKSFWKLNSLCPPAVSTSQEVKDILNKYLKQNPEQTVDNPAKIAARALVKAWGCETTPASKKKRPTEAVDMRNEYSLSLSCQSYKTSKEGEPGSRACFTYISGATETLLVNDDIEKTMMAPCPGEEVTEGQIVDVVIKWMDDHPDKRNLRAPAIIILALNERFPCDQVQGVR